MTRFLKMWALLGVAAALIVPRLDAQASDEGPALGVARVSLTNGDVTVRRGDSGDWVEARVNTPLVEGDTIATGPGSRAEVQLDYSNLIRLNENSEVTMASLANRSFRVQLWRGILTYSELKGGEADIDIETPHVAVRPRKNGRYRVEVLGDETAVTVRRGEAEIASAQGVETLKSGNTMLIRGAGDEVAFRVVDADPRDEWDEWNERRDHVLNKSDSYRYLSRSISGGYDLDGHGHWRYVSGYGYSWFPSVTVGWAPYRHGRWVWLDYYGWTWESYEPWGWAPYHYGRWYRHASYGWGWYPGVYHHHHHWRPALVAFFGWGSHSGFSLGVGYGHGFGHVGWVPLGPGEAYYPWYGRHFYGHGRRGNTTIYVDNSVNIYNTYRNARHSNGVTVVDANGFSRGQVNNPRSLRDTELRRATLMRGQIPVVPARESRGRVVRASNSSAATNARSRGGVRQNAFFNREAGRRTVRADNGRVPFDQQREQMQRSIRAYADNSGRRSVGTSGAAGSQGRVDRAGVTDGRTQRAGGAGVRGTDASVDAGRTRLEGRSGRTAQAVGRAGVRGSDTTGARDAQRRSDTTSRATAGSDRNSRAGVRSRATETTRERGSDWRQFGNSGSSSRTVDRGTSRARSGPSSSATVDRSSSRNDRGSRVERTSPSRSESSDSATRSRGSSASSSSRVERSRSVQRAPQQRAAPVHRSAPSRAPSVQRSAPSRAPSVQRSAPRAAPSNGGGSSSRSSRSRSRSELRGSNDSGFSRFGPTSSTSARASRADQGRSSGRFVPRAASRVSSSSSGRGSIARSRSAASSARVGRSSSRVPSRDSRVSRSTASRGGISRSRSTASSSPRIRSSAPSVSRGGGSRRVGPSQSGISRSSRPIISRSRSAPSSSGRSISRGGSISRSSGGGRSISRGGSSRGSVSRSSGGVRGGRSRGR